MKRIVLALAAFAVVLGTLLSAQGGDPNYGKPKRLNKMLEKEYSLMHRRLDKTRGDATCFFSFANVI